MSRRKLPEGFAIIALSTEAVKRGTSYGKLVAAITEEERKKIIERYKKKWLSGKWKEA